MTPSTTKPSLRLKIGAPCVSVKPRICDINVLFTMNLQVGTRYCGGNAYIKLIKSLYVTFAAPTVLTFEVNWSYVAKLCKPLEEPVPLVPKAAALVLPPV